jgi:hypothetical protein
MKFRILNGEPLQFYNANGDLIGSMEISSSGEMFIRAHSGSGDITIGDPFTTGDVQIGTTAAPTTLNLMGGGTISANGNELTLGDASIGDRVRLINATFTQSLNITGSLRVTGSAYADNFIGNGSGLIFSNLPTTEPTTTGSLWISGSSLSHPNSGYLMVFNP